VATNWDRIVGRLVVVGAAIVVVGIVVGYVLPHDFGVDVSISLTSASAIAPNRGGLRAL